MMVGTALIISILVGVIAGLAISWAINKDVKNGMPFFGKRYDDSPAKEHRKDR